MSESQERMMAVVEPDKVERFLEICEKWEVDATVVGEVTDDRAGSSIEWHGEVVVDVPPRTVAHEGPVYERPFARPAWQDALQADGAEKLPRPADRRRAARDPAAAGRPARTSATGRGSPTSTTATSSATPSSPSRRTPAWSASTRRPGSGVALATDCNGRFAKLDPYAGAQLALAEAYRNVAVSGARPLAVSDCLNFGSPEDPDVMWQFAEAVRGLADGCQELGIPVTGGNVSLYNQTGETAILPTPVVAVLGVIDDVRRRTPTRLRRGRADRAPARDDARGAVRARSGRTSCTATSAGCRRWSTWPPSGRWPRCWSTRRGDGLLDAAHDLSDGGLAQALVEACLRHGVGATRRPAPATRSSRCSPSRRAGRSWPCAPSDVDGVHRSAAPRLGVPGRGAGRHRWRRRRGRRRREGRVRGVFTLPAELRAAWSAHAPRRPRLTSREARTRRSQRRHRVQRLAQVVPRTSLSHSPG